MANVLFKRETTVRVVFCGFLFGVLSWFFLVVLGWSGFLVHDVLCLNCVVVRVLVFVLLVFVLCLSLYLSTPRGQL